MQYNGTDVEVSAVVSNVIAGDSVNVTKYFVGGQTYDKFYATQLGVYDVTATELDNANYTLDNATNATHTFELEKGIAVVTFDVSKANACTVTVDNLCEGVTVSVRLYNKYNVASPLETVRLASGESYTFEPESDGEYYVIGYDLFGTKSAYYELPSPCNIQFQVTSSTTI